MAYQLIDESIGLIFRFQGDVTIEEMTAANIEGWEHPDCDKHLYQIWDLENVCSLEIDTKDVVNTAAMDKVHTTHTLAMKISLISDDDHIIEILDAYVASAKGENLEAQIFTCEADARKWIDV